MRVGGKEVFRLAMKVGEIAAAATGDEDFLADAVRMFEDSDAAAAFSGFDGAQQSRRAATKNKHIEFAIHGWNGDGRCSIFQGHFRHGGGKRKAGTVLVLWATLPVTASKLFPLRCSTTGWLRLRHRYRLVLCCRSCWPARLFNFFFLWLFLFPTSCVAIAHD